MTTLADFLLARIAEDEAAAEDAGPWTPTFIGAASIELTHDGLMVDPARVLADCAAKRAIVERASVECVCTDHGAERVEGCPQCVACHAVTTADGYVLADLAAPYADHPDYDPAWKVEP